MSYFQVILIGLLAGLFAISSVLYSRMVYYDHKHIEMICNQLVTPGSCDYGLPQKSK